MTINRNSCMDPTHGSNRMELMTSRKSDQCIYTTISTESVIEIKSLQKQVNSTTKQIRGH